MISRLYTQVVLEKLAKYPAVAILGPRQCGKTTLAKALGGHYFDMETDGSVIRLDAEWDRLADGDKLVIIDEAQEVPEVFRRLRGTIDADRKRNGRYLLLGSVSPLLMQGISESLAGRMGMVEMGPLIIPEMKNPEIDSLWLCGGFPDGGILNPAMFPEWQHDYIRALTSRDLPNWGLPAKPQLTMRLLRLLAALHGQPLNASQIGSVLGIDYKTIISYCDFLEGAYLLRRLPAYFPNIKKRLTKAPRIYLRDSGIQHSLMQIKDLDALYSQPWLGQSWEGFIIEQTIAALNIRLETPSCMYFRSSDGYEIDLVLDWGTELWAIEIKLTSNPSTDELKRLNKAADLIKATRRILICRIAVPIETETILVTHPKDWLHRLLSTVR